MIGITDCDESRFLWWINPKLEILRHGLVTSFVQCEFCWTAGQLNRPRWANPFGCFANRLHSIKRNWGVAPQQGCRERHQTCWNTDSRNPNRDDE